MIVMYSPTQAMARFGAVKVLKGKIIAVCHHMFLGVIRYVGDV